MKILVDGTTIIMGPFVDDDTMATGTQQVVEVASWPEKSPGDPYRKMECQYKSGKVVALTASQIADVHAARAAKEELRKTDTDTIRIIEDIFDVLIKRGLVKSSDFEDAVVKKLQARAAERDKIKI